MRAVWAERNNGSGRFVDQSHQAGRMVTAPVAIGGRRLYSSGTGLDVRPVTRARASVAIAWPQTSKTCEAKHEYLGVPDACQMGWSLAGSDGDWRADAQLKPSSRRHSPAPGSAPQLPNWLRGFDSRRPLQAV